MTNPPEAPSEAKIAEALERIASPQWQRPRLHRYTEYHAAMRVLAAALAACRRDAARLDTLEANWSAIVTATIAEDEMHPLIELKVPLRELIDAASKTTP